MWQVSLLRILAVLTYITYLLTYIMWQPYRREGEDVPEEANVAFRYKLSWDA